MRKHIYCFLPFLLSHRATYTAARSGDSGMLTGLQGEFIYQWAATVIVFQVEKGVVTNQSFNCDSDIPSEWNDLPQDGATGGQ
jgi:hypothetical protein